MAMKKRCVNFLGFNRGVNQHKHQPSQKSMPWQAFGPLNLTEMCKTNNLGIQISIFRFGVCPFEKNRKYKNPGMFFFFLGVVTCLFFVKVSLFLGSLYWFVALPFRTSRTDGASTGT